MPLNPEEDGWHWLVLVSSARPVPQHWTAGGSFGGGWSSLSMLNAGQRYRYIGPCLLPAEVARLREALEFYADTFCELGAADECCGKLDTEHCSGCIARAALAKEPGHG